MPRRGSTRSGPAGADEEDATSGTGSVQGHQSEPDEGQDPDDESSEVDEPGSADDDAVLEDPEEEQEYQLLDKGAVVEGKVYPDEEAGEGREMVVSLTPSRAQELQLGGVRLVKFQPDAGGK